MSTAVHILLPTFNGSAYIPELFRSLQGQSRPDWLLWARDDGSTDGTPRLLEELAARDGRLRLASDGGLHIGAAAGFWQLMKAVPEDAPYLMFCDQDDVWLPHKIERTLDAMRAAEARAGTQTPLLVHSDLRVVDEDLREVSPSFWRFEKIDPRRRSLAQLLIHNTVTGCTVMINRALRRALADDLPDAVIMHDWWLALAAAAFGTIECVPEPLVLYRQHGRNDTGAKHYDWRYILRTARSPAQARRDFDTALSRHQAQARAFLAVYGPGLAASDRETLRRFCDIRREGFWSRRRTLLRYGFMKRGFFRKLSFLMFI